jgi:YbbR domain-containing protein
MMFRAFPLKIISLVVALLLAYAVHSARNASVVSLFVPIEVKNAPEDKAIVKPAKRGVQLTLKGPSFLIGQVASSPPALKIKLPDTGEDRVAVTLRRTDVTLPASIEVLSIEPSQIEFVFEPLERQDLRVEVPRIGQLARELVLESIEVAPKIVTVRGPRSEVKALKSIESEPLNLSDIDSSTETTLSLRALGPTISPSTRTVVAKITIGQPPKEKVFSGQAVELRVGSGVGGLTVQPERVTVTVSGAPSLLSNVSDQSVIPYVRVVEVKGTGALSKKVEVEVPQGLKVISIEPSSVAIQRQEVIAAKSAVRRK